MLERDVGVLEWSDFQQLCKQRFGPALGTNHLADLARLPFRGSIVEYQESFLAKMAHAGPLSPTQQVLLFMGGLPDTIRVDVELHSPQELQRAMSLARAYERCVAALNPPCAALSTRSRPCLATSTTVSLYCYQCDNTASPTTQAV